MTDLAFVPSTRNIDLYAGDGATIVLNITTQKGAAIPILGPVAAHIRAHRLDPNPVDQFKVELTDARDGTIRLSLNATQTTGLLNGDERFTGSWDCQWTPAGSDPITLVQGAVTCALDVTRP